jgi:hypothetical protein
MKNIHILPTNKPSRIYLIKSNNKLGITSNNPDFTENFGSGTQNQHIYITNSEVKKNGDWVLSKLNEVVKFCSLYCQNSYEKIILTTDQDLIKDGVQAINDEFLEWFVKNPSCESIEIQDFPMTEKYNSKGEYIHRSYWIYKIIIPKEKPKQEQDKNKYSEEDMKRCWQEATEDMRKQFSTSYSGTTFEKFIEQFNNK